MSVPINYLSFFICSTDNPVISDIILKKIQGYAKVPL